MGSPTDELVEKRIEELARLFRDMGFDMGICRKPDNPYDGVVGFINDGPNRQRQVAAVIEGEPPSFWYYLSDRYETIGPDVCRARDTKGMHRMTGYAATAPIDPAFQAGIVRGLLVLANPEDPLATTAEIRETLDRITDRGRNTSSMGNPRGDDLRAIGHVLHRLLDRVERLEERISPGPQ